MAQPSRSQPLYSVRQGTEPAVSSGYMLPWLLVRAPKGAPTALVAAIILAGWVHYLHCAAYCASSP
jgi:hypothetical protein